MVLGVIVPFIKKEKSIYCRIIPLNYASISLITCNPEFLRKVFYIANRQVLLNEATIKLPHLGREQDSASGLTGFFLASRSAVNWLIYDFNTRGNLSGIQDVDTPGDHHCCVQRCRRMACVLGSRLWAPFPESVHLQTTSRRGGVSYPVVCDSLWPHDCSPPGSSVHGILCRQEGWSGLSFPSPEDLPDPGIEPGSPALQADSLPAELSGKPHTRRQGSINIF